MVYNERKNKKQHVVVQKSPCSSYRSAVNMRKIIGPVFFEEANSDRYFKLIPTQLFGELTQKKKLIENHLNGRNEGWLSGIS